MTKVFETKLGKKDEINVKKIKEKLKPVSPKDQKNIRNHQLEERTTSMGKTLKTTFVDSK